MSYTTESRFRDLRKVLDSNEPPGWLLIRKFGFSREIVTMEESVVGPWSKRSSNSAGDMFVGLVMRKVLRMTYLSCKPPVPECLKTFIFCPLTCTEFKIISGSWGQSGSRLTHFIWWHSAIDSPASTLILVLSLGKPSHFHQEAIQHTG